MVPVPDPAARGRTRNPDKGKLFWLKDCWRSDAVESEASMYRHLKEKNVENIPYIKCMGDVFDGTIRQETLNDTLRSDEEANK